MKRSRLFIEAVNAYDDGDAIRALSLMEECAEQDDPVACFTAALWHSHGDGVPKNVDRGRQWLDRFETIAENGDIEAQWELGQQYRFANLLPLDIKRANYWLEQAAEGGSGEAQHHLAWYLESGQFGYPVDLQEAAMWYQRAFDQGNPETLYTFAIKRFRDGQPTEEAISLLQQAADKGLVQAADVLRNTSH